MSRYATLRAEPAVWSIFDCAAALFVAPMFDAVKTYDDLRAARHQVTSRAKLRPRRPLFGFRAAPRRSLTLG